MYFFAITVNTYTNEPHIACGDSNVVDVDGRHSLHTQYEIAYDHLVKRKLSLVGIACFRKISDVRQSSSVATHKTGGLDFSSMTAFNQDF